MPDDLTRRSFVAGLGAAAAAAAVPGVGRKKPRRNHTRTITDEVRMRSTVVTIGGAAPTQSMIYGHTLFAADLYLGVHESIAQCTARTLATYGRIPMAKVFYGGALPTTWQSGFEGIVPEKRVMICHKDINAGRIASHRQSIPTGWHVYYTYWQEANDDIRDGTLTPEGVPLTPALYKSAYNTLFDTIHTYDDPEVRGVAEAWHCFIQPAGTGQTAATVASYVELANTDGVSFDPYLNPHGGSGLDQNPYTTSSYALASAYDVLALLGWPRWGIAEFNTPMRNWDRPAGNARTTALLDYIDYCLTQFETQPEFILLWNADGNNWDQRIIDGNPIFPPGGAGARTVTYGGPESFIQAWSDIIATSA